jgi:hypothetical protein
LSDTTHRDEIEQVPTSNRDGWIWTSRKKLELRRIPYLSRLRNQVMQRMDELAKRDQPLRFEKVLWLNDVVFTVCCRIIFQYYLNLTCLCLDPRCPKPPSYKRWFVCGCVFSRLFSSSIVLRYLCAPRHSGIRTSDVNVALLSVLHFSTRTCIELTHPCSVVLERDGRLRREAVLLNTRTNFPRHSRQPCKISSRRV